MSNYGQEVDLVLCPFNKSHFLRCHRLQYHIIKCKKHHKGRKVACPFNASEYIESEEMVQHLMQCKFRIARETHLHYSTNTITSEKPYLFNNVKLPQNNENWGIDNPDEDESEEEFQ